METFHWAATAQLAPLLSSELMWASRSMGSEMARPLAEGRGDGALVGGEGSARGARLRGCHTGGQGLGCRGPHPGPHLN